MQPYFLHLPNGQFLNIAMATTIHDMPNGYTDGDGYKYDYPHISVKFGKDELLFVGENRKVILAWLDQFKEYAT